MDIRQKVLSAAALLIGAPGLLVVAAAAPSAAVVTAPRTFSCQGGLGEAFTIRQVTGTLNSLDRPSNTSVYAPPSSTPLVTRATGAKLLGPSAIHAGYVAWDITGANANHDHYTLSIPPVLPGAGGLFDADLQIDFNRGVDGNWQIPMFDCTVSGGPAWLTHPSGARAFSCTGSLGEAFTTRTVTGHLTATNIPWGVTVRQGGGAVDSSRGGRALLVGPSVLHAGYAEWDITGPLTGTDTYHLSIPPVLPRPGGFFDADLEIAFNGGIDGSWQIPMFDCVVS